MIYEKIEKNFFCPKLSDCSNIVKVWKFKRNKEKETDMQKTTNMMKLDMLPIPLYSKNTM